MYIAYNDCNGDDDDENGDGDDDSNNIVLQC